MKRFLPVLIGGLVGVAHVLLSLVVVIVQCPRALNFSAINPWCHSSTASLLLFLSHSLNISTDIPLPYIPFTFLIHILFGMTIGFVFAFLRNQTIGRIITLISITYILLFAVIIGLVYKAGALSPFLIHPQLFVPYDSSVEDVIIY